MPYELTEEQRQVYRETSIRSQLRKIELLQRHAETIVRRRLPTARLDPNTLMPAIIQHGLTALSLFSGGGGLDLGFDRGGFEHVASYEVLEICARTLKTNRPHWAVHGGADGDVVNAGWTRYRGVDVVHGGPPCQPFSIAGRQEGANDPRNMWPQFVRCVLEVRPRAFVAENVPGLLDDKFSQFVAENILAPLSGRYTIKRFVLSADDFGVPQARKRVFFVGFRNKREASRFSIPECTHGESYGLAPQNTARHSIGLAPIGFDSVVPTLRSGFTGPRKTTSVVNSKASMIAWNRLEIWPHGVQTTREQAAIYPPENGHHRLSAADCGIFQGFPEQWKFEGAAYQVLGQIGNSVCPPVAYAVAKHVAVALGAIE